MKKSVHFALALTVVVCLVATSLTQEPAGRGRPQGPPQGPPGRGGLRGLPGVAALDANRDGELSAEEIAGATAKLKEFDTNRDGKVSGDELRGTLPLGRGPRGPRGGGPPFGAGRRFEGVSESDLERNTLAQNDVEKRILAALDEMRQGPRFANVSPTDGRLLRLLTEAVNAKRVVEIGTSTGESAVWLALAVESTGGHVYTHEIDESRAKIAEESFKKAGVDKLVTLILGDAHETVKRYKDPHDPLFVDTDKQQSIDMLFLDADKEGYIDYLEKLMPLVRPGGLIIAHNMNTRQADASFVTAVTEDPNLETLILLKEGTGVGVTLKKR